MNKPTTFHWQNRDVSEAHGNAERPPRLVCRKDDAVTMVLRPSHITVDGQSTSPSWCRAPQGAHRSDCYGPLSRGAPHLTRGRVCHLSEVCLCHLYNYTYSPTINLGPG
jgi:hypothetical protein